METTPAGAAVFFLCPRADLTRERLGYAEALERRGVTVHCLDDAPGAARSLGAIEAAGLSPTLIVHPDGPEPVLPAGLETSPVPTACFQIDSFMARERRARWALLFDRAFVFHAADLEHYRAAGHPNVVPLFHAARAGTRHAPEAPRDIDVAMVGRTDGPYQRRLRCLQALDPGIRTNEWRRPHAPDEASALYARSKIVLNVGRDDSPQDVGVRFGEAMIAGALFATIVPSELTDFGFEAGRDFVGFEGPDDVSAVCRRFSDDPEARIRIATSGQQRVLADHTYDRRASVILEGAQGLTAPARRWDPQTVALTRLDYFAAKGRLRDALAELRTVGIRSGKRSTRALNLLGRAAGRRILNRVSGILNKPS